MANRTGRHFSYQSSVPAETCANSGYAFPFFPPFLVLLPFLYYPGSVWEHSKLS